MYRLFMELHHVFRGAKCSQVCVTVCLIDMPKTGSDGQIYWQACRPGRFGDHVYVQALASYALWC